MGEATDDGTDTIDVTINVLMDCAATDEKRKWLTASVVASLAAHDRVIVVVCR